MRQQQPFATNPAMQASAEIHAKLPGLACGLVRRCLVMVYDALIVIALLFIAALLALPFTGDRAQVLHDPWYTAWIMGVWFAYFGWCWTQGGQTLGMRAWRVRICSDQGGRIGWWAALLRFAVSCVSAAALGLGFLWAWTNPQRASWHDLASRTRLRYTPRPPRRRAASHRTAQDVDDGSRQQ